MKKEFIVETKSGSLYRLDYQKSLFAHGTRFTLRQLYGSHKDFGKDDYSVIFFGGSGGPKVIGEDVDLEHFKVGTMIWAAPVGDMQKGVNTSPIVKIYERIR